MIGALLGACSGDSGNNNGDGGGGGAHDFAGLDLTGADFATPPPGPQDFPQGSPWYHDSSGDSLDSESSQVISGLAGVGGWGNGNVFQIDFSFHVLHADASVARRSFTPTGDFYDPDCDPAPIPVPPGGSVEGEADYACAGGGDCHLIVYQGQRLYEAWIADITGGMATGGTFTSGCAVVWDLTRNYWTPAAPPNFSRGDQCTSADAAGYPIAPLLFYGTELAAGHIDHAIRFILPNARIRNGEYVHPATHSTTATSGGANTPPYGAHFRLKSTFNLASLPNDNARTVARALQKYGMYLSDGGQIALTADESAAAYLDARDLDVLQVTDFEMVDGGQRIPYTGDCMHTPITN
jgi:hypothetical protein